MAYVVSRAGDAHEALQDRLDSIANQGGRVISVTWEPRRRIIIVLLLEGSLRSRTPDTQ
jgi:hypothetical protein